MTKPKKILFVCDKNQSTSFGRLTLNLIKAVAPHFEPHVLWLKTPKYFPKSASLTEAAMRSTASVNFVSHECWAKSMITGFYSFRAPLKKLIEESAFDVVFFLRPELGFLVPMANESVRRANARAQTVMYLHDNFAETLYPRSPKFILLNRFYIKNCVEANLFVYNSMWTRNACIAHFGSRMKKAPGEVIGCPIDFDLFHRLSQSKTSEERRIFREKHGIKNYKAMCLNVSLDEPRKNIETYFEMARLRPDVAFVRVGKFSERLRNIVNGKKLLNVFHIDHFNAAEIGEFYHYTDLVVYPSLLEGFGLPPVEAIACGVPAVCSDSSSLTENLKGICPLISPLTDAEAYAKVLDKVLAGENVVDWEAAEKRLKRFSLQAYSERLCAFLLKMVM